MFGTVLDRLDTFFGRAFLLSRFFPCLIFVGVNSLLAFAAFPDLRPHLGPMLDRAATASGIVYLLAGFVAIAAFAYATAPLGRAVTTALEGDWLLTSRWLAPLGKSMVLFQSLRQERLDRREGTLFEKRTALPGADQVKARLEPAAERGWRRGKSADPGAVDEAEAKIRGLRTKRQLREVIDPDELEVAIASLAEAIARNSTLVADRLNRLYIEFVNQIVPYAVQVAEEREARANQLRELEFSRAVLAPTRLGNLAAALRSYCATRYGIDFDAFWPGFLLAMRKDDKLNAAIAAAKIQLDFAVQSFALTTVSAAAWIVLLLWLGGGHLRMLLAVALGPPLAAAWLWAVHATYEEFAETARAAIDNGRFELLTALHQPLPASLEGERQLWKRWAELAVLNVHEPDIVFKHPPA